MKLKKYLKEEEAETKGEETAEKKPSEKVVEKLIDFFKNFKGEIDDNDVHKFAEKEKFEPAEIEEVVYKLAASFWANGKSKGFTGEYDPEQLKMGMAVEMEHTNDVRMAERISKDHLSEIKDYYSRLAQMEKEGKAALGKKE